MTDEQTGDVVPLRRNIDGILKSLSELNVTLIEQVMNRICEGSRMCGGMQRIFAMEISTEKQIFMARQ